MKQELQAVADEIMQKLYGATDQTGGFQDE